MQNLITWVYETNSFVPCAKIVGNEAFSIVNDYIGRPIQAYDNNGKLVWQTDYDIYGNLRNLKGERNFIPFRQLGQYEDIETGLYYNRFRYYSPETGLYISKDPIGLTGGFALYAYVKDVNSWVDIFGLFAKIHLNSNNAIANFGLYEIKINGDLYKIGKADLGRVTELSGLPTRLHQQVRRLEKIYGKGNVIGTVVEDLGITTTEKAKIAEKAQLQAHYDVTGEILEGNKKSFKPKINCG